MKKLVLLLHFAACVAMSAEPKAQTITTVAGHWTSGIYNGDGIPATTAGLGGIFGIAIDNVGNLFLADNIQNRIRKVNTASIITTEAGTGVRGFSADGVAASAAMLGLMCGMTADNAGNVYFSDSLRIRKIDAAGIITTIAGTGMMGYSGDGGPAAMADIGFVSDILLDGAGNMYICEGSFSTVRKIDAAGIITTVAGNGTAGFSGDGGPATAAQLNIPYGLAMGSSGNLYISDRNNNRIRRVNATGIITTIAGTGVAVNTGDGGPANFADIYMPHNIVLDGNGNLYIGTHVHTVRKINAGGIISTFAGTDGVYGYTGDGGQARNARCSAPRYLELYGDGALYMSDLGNNLIRLVKDDTPRFVTSVGMLSVCRPTPVNTAVAVADADTGQELAWQLIALPAHGVLAASYTALATGATVTPTVFTYIPAVGYAGPDAFTMRVYDGMLADTVTVSLAVHATTPGTVTGADTVCAGDTIMLSSTSGGGAWSVSGGAATVSPSGVVTGIAEGTAAVSYTISNPCTTATAIHAVYVADCSAGISALGPQSAGVVVFPNPSTGTFFIQLPQAFGIATLTDMQGRHIGSANLTASGSGAMQCSVPGIYLLTVKTATGLWREKVTVTK